MEEMEFEQFVDPLAEALEGRCAVRLAVAGQRNYTQVLFKLVCYTIYMYSGTPSFTSNKIEPKCSLK